MLNSIKISAFVFLVTFNLFAQQFSVNKIEPGNWWSGMKTNDLQLMIYGKNLNEIKVSSSSKLLSIVKVHYPENSNYLFIDVKLNKNIKPGSYKLNFQKGDEKYSIDFPVLKRPSSDNKYKGFNQNDAVYLIFPDRFANGDTLNDFLENSKEEFEFGSLNGRHGGDITGIISKLDYLSKLGVTALWLCPMLENNMWMSYHGYAATDLYRIDPRFGTSELYKELVDKAHEKGIKIILDHVSNHIGNNHPWYNNLPMKDWFNGVPGNHTRTNYDVISFFDVNADPVSVDYVQRGWFEDYMPDVNQSNPFVKKYMIQNTIWWIETLGIDGIREDTYGYSDQSYLAEWAETIINEYPNFNIVGEILKGEPSFLARFQRNNIYNKNFNSNLPCVTDFGVRDAVTNFVSGEKPIVDIYETFVQDYLYADRDNLMVFVDNHDIPRLMYSAKNNINKYKIGMLLTLFTRGIPKLLYGTEIGITGTDHHGEIRAPFPGGFEKDSISAFCCKGRNAYQDSVFTLTKNLLNLRKNNTVLREGKFTHYYPLNDIYIFRKTLENNEYVFVINGLDKVNKTDFGIIKHRLKSVKSMYEVLENYEISCGDSINLELKPYESKIFKLIK